MNKTILLSALAALAFAQPAAAAPGVGSKVYGATVEKGVTEIEARYGRLSGGPASGAGGGGGSSGSRPQSRPQPAAFDTDLDDDVPF